MKLVYIMPTSQIGEYVSYLLENHSNLPLISSKVFLISSIPSCHEAHRLTSGSHARKTHPVCFRVICTHPLSRPSYTQTRRIVLSGLGDHMEVNMIDLLVSPSAVVLQQVVVFGALS